MIHQFFQGHYTYLKHYISRAVIAFIPFIFIVCCFLCRPDWIQHFDERVLSQLYGYGNPVFHQFIGQYTRLADGIMVVAITIFCALNFNYYTKQRRIMRWFLVTIGIGAGILNPLMKFIIQRQRPSVVSHLINQGGFSFPSGHSAGSMILYGTIAILVYEQFKHHRWISWLAYVILFFFPTTIALSRIYLGVHYPSDTIAGLSLGLAVIILAAGYLRAFIIDNAYWEEFSSKK